jgi:hypothetical protein
MKTFALSILAPASRVNALIAHGANCCFHLSTSGGASGPTGQLTDDQNRIGGGRRSPVNLPIGTRATMKDG